MDTIPGTDAFGRLGRKEAAAALGVAPKTLANWNTDGLGPKAYRTPGTRNTFYLARDIREFALRGVAA